MLRPFGLSVPSSKNKPHLLLLSAGVITTAAFETAYHDVIKKMGSRLEMFSYRKGRRIVLNATQVFSVVAPQSHQCLRNQSDDI